jgi:hypothetical protein
MHISVNKCGLVKKNAEKCIRVELC